MSNNTDILNTLIRNQKNAIRDLSLFACIVVLLGIFLIIFSTVFPDVLRSNDTLKTLMSIGGGFISTLSAYPFNQLIARREKMRIYEEILTKMEKMTEPELRRAEELIWKSVEKIV